MKKMRFVNKSADKARECKLETVSRECMNKRVYKEKSVNFDLL